MAHAAFPLPIATPSSLIDARTRQRLRALVVPLGLFAVVAALTATALVQLELDSERLGAALTTREGVNRAIGDDVETAQRTRALAAERADGLRLVIAEQLASLDSREGFLP